MRRQCGGSQNAHPAPLDVPAAPARHAGSWARTCELHGGRVQGRQRRWRRLGGGLLLLLAAAAVGSGSRGGRCGAGGGRGRLAGPPRPQRQPRAVRWPSCQLPTGCVGSTCRSQAACALRRAQGCRPSSNHPGSLRFAQTACETVVHGGRVAIAPPITSAWTLRMSSCASVAPLGPGRGPPGPASRAGASSTIWGEYRAG